MSFQFKGAGGGSMKSRKIVGHVQVGDRVDGGCRVPPGDSRAEPSGPQQTLQPPLHPSFYIYFIHWASTCIFMCRKNSFRQVRFFKPSHQRVEKVQRRKRRCSKNGRRTAEQGELPA